MSELATLLAIEAGINVGMEVLIDNIPALRKLCRHNTMNEPVDELAKTIEDHVAKGIRQSGLVETYMKKIREDKKKTTSVYQEIEEQPCEIKHGSPMRAEDGSIPL